MHDFGDHWLILEPDKVAPLTCERVYGLPGIFTQRLKAQTRQAALAADR